MVLMAPLDQIEGYWPPNGSAGPYRVMGHAWRAVGGDRSAVAGDETCRAPSGLALARALAARPADPRSLIATIERDLYFRVEVPAQFVEIVKMVFPDDAVARQAILEADGPGDRDEGARVEAFLAAVDRRLFPVEECFEEYAVVVRTIPFRPLGFEDETLEGLYDRPGLQALIALVAPDAPATAARHQLLHERHGVPLATLALLPREPPSLAEIGRRFDRGSRAAVIDMARWLRGETGTAFLDSTDESAEWQWWPWTRANVAALTEQWARADTLLARVGALADWLEGDLPRRFRELVLIAGRRDAAGRSRRAARRRKRKHGRGHCAP